MTCSCWNKIWPTRTLIFFADSKFFWTVFLKMLKLIKPLFFKVLNSLAEKVLIMVLHSTWQHTQATAKFVSDLSIKVWTWSKKNYSEIQFSVSTVWHFCDLKIRSVWKWYEQVKTSSVITTFMKVWHLVKENPRAEVSAMAKPLQTKQWSLHTHFFALIIINT